MSDTDSGSTGDSRGSQSSWKTLLYFDEVQRVERELINIRRAKREREPIKRNRPTTEGGDFRKPKDDGELPPNLSGPECAHIDSEAGNRAIDPDKARSRPKPQPSDASGLALSGGGIRSAAFCLGVLQALHTRKLLMNFDYLSTVSGGGYIGASLTAALNANGGSFPFVTGNGDVRDADSVGYLRNYSNYLLPRNRSGFRNIAEVAVIVTRGIFSNIVLMLPIFMFAVMVTAFAFSGGGEEKHLGYLTTVVQAIMQCLGLGGAAAYVSNPTVACLLVAAIALSATISHWATPQLSLKIVMGFLITVAIFVGAIVWIPTVREILLLPLEAPLSGSFGVTIEVACGILVLVFFWAITRSGKAYAQDDASSFFQPQESWRRRQLDAAVLEVSARIVLNQDRPDDWNCVLVGRVGEAGGNIGNNSRIVGSTGLLVLRPTHF